MFDEYDEGTAIMPMSDDPPQPFSQWGHFVTNDGRPNDWWMVLAGQARERLLQYRTPTSQMPTDAEVAIRAQIGPDASIDLGTANQEKLLHLMEAPGARTTAVTIAGKDCRSNQPGGADQSLNFDLDPAFAREVAAGLEATIELEYLDHDGEVEFTLQYDALSDPAHNHPKTIITRGTGEWRTVRFKLADGFFGDRQAGGSDFRIQVGRGTLYLNRVWVAKSWGVMPLVDIQPQGQATVEGDSASLHVLAHGTQPLSYQWWFNGSPLPAAARTNLDLPQVTPAQAGDYYAVVVTPTGSVTSQVATVTVQALPKVQWVRPSDILYGTALSALQLNATANVPGTFEYDPPAGTVLNAGLDQILSVTFKPTASSKPDMITQTVRLNVSAAPLIISAQNAIRPFATPDPPLTITYAGWVHGDTAASLTAPATLHTSATPESPPGVYLIVVQDASSPNYDIQFVPGVLTITQAEQTINFKELGSARFGDPPLALSASASSGLPVAYTVVAGHALIDSERLTLTGAGLVTIEASQPGDANYQSAESIRRSLSVEKATQSITFDAIPPKALGLDPFPVHAVASSELPVAFSVVRGPATIDGSIVTLQGLGEVVIEAAQAGDDNFQAAPTVDHEFSVVSPIRSPRLLATGEFGFTFTGEPGRSYTLEGSHDLSGWVQLVTLFNPAGVLEFSDSSAPELQWRFYRVVLQSMAAPGKP